MRWLRREDGAVAVTVAICLVLLVGMGALVLDVGNAYWERRQLQNGADAAALAAAQEYAVGGSSTDADGVARQYADVNNVRGAFVEDIDRDGNEVTVITRTGDVSSGGVLSSWLAGVIGHDDYFARATASAMWGSPNAGPALPITLGVCEWKNATGAGDDWQNADFPTANIVIFTHDPKKQDDCLGPAGQYTGGGFGHLTGADPAAGYVCSALVSEGSVDGEPGGNPPASKYNCTAQHFRDLVDDQVEVLVPIFTEVTGSGANQVFHIGGFGGFVLTGFKLGGGGGSGEWEYPTGSPPCSGGDRCISGTFVRFVSLGDAEDLGAIDLGAQVVVLTR